MRQAANVAVVIGIVSLVVGVISRLTLTPLMGIEAHAFQDFTQTCLLFAIAMLLSSSPATR